MDWLEYFLIPFTDIKLLLIAVFGTLAGFIMGALPGLSVTMAVTLLVSLTYSWDTIPAIVLMIAVFFGGVYGGSRSAILLNIPGTTSSLATTFDGYPMAQRGEAGLAIGLATLFSVIGGLFGMVVMGVASPLLADFALSFDSRDYFLLMVLGLLLVGSLSTTSLAKAVIGAAAGVFLGLVGLDSMTGVERFTFGFLHLKSGISYIACLLGLFGLAEVLYQMHQLKTKDGGKKPANIGRYFPTFKQFLRYLPLTLRAGGIGTAIGALPGAGGEIASIVAYDHAKRTVKKPSRPFGQGAHEGVVAPDVANMAAVGGALIPMITLGIPGDAVTAVIIGALFIHGLKPGPMLMAETPELFWVIVGCGVISVIFVFVWGLTAVSAFARVITIPKHVLLPIIAFLTVVGAYAVNNSVVDVYWMIAFGIIGYFMKKYDFPTGPMVLGIILGPMLESNFRRGIIAEEGLSQFLLSLVTHPLSLILTLAVVLTILTQTSFYRSWKNKRSLRKKIG